MLIKKSDENDDIMKFPHRYYLFKHIYCDSPSLYIVQINIIETSKTVNTLFL